MNEMNVLDRLRPDVPPLTETEIEQLRTQVFGGAARAVGGDDVQGPRTQEAGTPVQELAPTRSGRGVRRQWVVALAAALTLTVVAAVWSQGRSATLMPGDGPAPTGPDDTQPADSEPAPATATLTSQPVTSPELIAAMAPEGTVLVLNGSGIGGLGGSLTAALQRSGYSVAPAANATESIAESVLYFRADAPTGALALLPPAIPIARVEQLTTDALPTTDSADVDSADLIVVLGTDLADAPWTTAPQPMVTDVQGTLLVLDASGSPGGRDRSAERIADLAAVGIDVIDGGQATRPLEESMLMPVTPSTRWTFAVAQLTGIGGFDSWSPELLDGSLPPDIDAVLVIGDAAAQGSRTALETPYTVRVGDYLADIADRHGVALGDLVAYNRWPDGADHALLPGDVIRIPPGDCCYAVQVGDSWTSIAEQAGASVDELLAANGWTDAAAHSLVPGEVIALP